MKKLTRVAMVTRLKIFFFNENHNLMPSKHVCVKHNLESFLLLHVFVGNMPNVISYILKHYSAS